jgi:hypothetical protein
MRAAGLRVAGKDGPQPDGRAALRRVLLVLIAGFSIAAAPVFGAPSPAPSAVPTQSIVVPPDQTGAEEPPPEAAPDENATPDDEDAAPAPDDLNDDADSPDPVPSQADIPTEIPVVEYDFSKLPAPVARLRQQIIDAAKTGDPEKLRPIIDANGEPPQFGPNDTGDPIDYLKSQSGDKEGREILAILWEVLDAGYVHVDPGQPDEMYVWPYFARYPVDKLTPPQLVELFRLVYAGDYEDMLDYGLYTSFRVGLAPNGTWSYFLSD